MLADDGLFVALGSTCGGASNRRESLFRCLQW